jgi:hypothetical protein
VSQQKSSTKSIYLLSALFPYLNPADSRLIGMDESGFLADIVDFAAIQNVHLSQPYAELLIKSQMSIFRIEVIFFIIIISVIFLYHSIDSTNQKLFICVSEYKVAAC